MPKKVKKGEAPPFLHASGQWAKKVRGSTIYLGTDEAEANRRWRAGKSHWLKGETPPNSAASTLAELANVYAADLSTRVKAGKIEDRSRLDSLKSVGFVVEFFGRDTPIDHLTQQDFARLLEHLYKPIKRVPKDGKSQGGHNPKSRSPTTVAGHQRRIRAWFNWCHDSEYIDRLPRWGKQFDLPDAKTMRRARAANEARDLTAEEVRTLFGSCRTLAMKPIFLLAINGGLGAKDIAHIRLNQVPSLDAEEVWVDIPRLKTGAPRKILLWPETVQALRDYLPRRPRPAGSKNAKLLFLTRPGYCWVRPGSTESSLIDSIAQEFDKLRRRTKIKRATFYDLRRTFRTVASGTLDTEAVDFVMGHLPPESDVGSARYQQRIPDDRIKRVCEHVHSWLFPEPSSPKGDE